MLYCGSSTIIGSVSCSRKEIKALTSGRCASPFLPILPAEPVFRSFIFPSSIFPPPSAPNCHLAVHLAVVSHMAVATRKPIIVLPGQTSLQHEHYGWHVFCDIALHGRIQR